MDDMERAQSMENFYRAHASRKSHKRGSASRAVDRAPFGTLQDTNDFRYPKTSAAHRHIKRIPDKGSIKELLATKMHQVAPDAPPPPPPRPARKAVVVKKKLHPTSERRHVHLSGSAAEYAISAMGDAGAAVFNAPLESVDVLRRKIETQLANKQAEKRASARAQRETNAATSTRLTLESRAEELRKQRAAIATRKKIATSLDTARAAKQADDARAAAAAAARAERASREYTSYVTESDKWSSHVHKKHVSSPIPVCVSRRDAAGVAKRKARAVLLQRGFDGPKLDEMLNSVSEEYLPMLSTTASRR